MTSRALNMLATAVIKRVVDSFGRQKAQVEVTKGELIDDVIRMQNYGFGSNPPEEGSDSLIAFLGGSREQAVIVVADNRAFRLKNLESGEVAIYDDLGNIFKLGRDSVEVIAVTKLTASAPIMEVSVDSSATISAGASSIVITPSGVAITSTVLTHNGKNIGASHYHVGSPSTAVPV